LEADKQVKIKMKGMPLFSLLRELIDPEILDFKALNNQIIFYPLQIEKKIEKPKSAIIIRGLVTDERQNEAVPYCNIAIVGKALGTMTNLDGKFTIKIPPEFKNDTLGFSALGYETSYFPLDDLNEMGYIKIVLKSKTYHLKAIDIIQYNPEDLLHKVHQNIKENYENKYTLFTTYYRELTKENEIYTDISEAVLEVMKAPYSSEIKEDHVKFLKGRKGNEVKPFNDIRFKLKGGPYYITKLDVVKNNESFINPDFIHLYSYKFEHIELINNRETAVIHFEPINNLRDILYEGFLYIDVENWAISRVEFQYTRQGLKEARHTLIEKEPKYYKAIPTELIYTIQYKEVDSKWYLQSVHCSLKIKINNKEKKQKTKFHSISEIITTNIEKGDLQQFSRKEIFRSNEIITDKITGYDKLFWGNYNVIQPEEELIKALNNFDNQNLIITIR
jgi:hypothetical protein